MFPSACNRLMTSSHLRQSHLTEAQRQLFNDKGHRLIVLLLYSATSQEFINALK